MIDGKLVLLQAEDSNEDISIVLIIWEQLSSIVLLKDILEAISLILHHTTTCWLDLEYSLTFTMWEAHSIFIQLSAMDWYLVVKIWAEDRRCSFCLLSKKWKSQRPWIYWLLCTTSRAIHAQSMEETSRRGILGRYWSWNQRRISVLSNKIERNHSSRNTSSPLYFKSWKIGNWRNVVWKTIFVSSTTTKNLFETRPKEMINWVLQLNIGQLENSFNSHLEKHSSWISQAHPIP